MSLYNSHNPALLEQIIGKTVASAAPGEFGTDEEVTIEFTDGSSIRLRSWDYEGYSSGIYVTEPQ